jgi:phosphoglycerol geranylgeranyltransferase
MINNKAIYDAILIAKSNKKKAFALLIDPDKIDIGSIDKLVALAHNAGTDFFLIGGSLVLNNELDELITRIKSLCDIPVILFPGSTLQLSYKADALLLLSLISGRNADLLIGKHVESAPFLKKSPLEIISTGYMLIDGGIPTSVSYMSNSNPIPAGKDEIAVWRIESSFGANDFGSKQCHRHSIDCGWRHQNTRSSANSCCFWGRYHCSGQCHRERPLADKGTGGSGAFLNTDLRY